MSVREIIEDVLAAHDPMTALVAVFQVMRTQLQGEAATCEGVYGSVLAFQQRYGRVTEASVRQWLAELGEVADQDIPQNVLWAAASAVD